MAFCNLFVNLNFRLPHTHSCGCSMPFNRGWNFPPMPNFFGFNGGFGGFNIGFGIFNSNPFFGFNNCNNNIFSLYSQPTSSFVGGFNPIQTNMPAWNQPSVTSLWNQVPTNANGTSTTTWNTNSAWNTTPSWNNTPEKTSSYSNNSSSTGSKQKTSTQTYHKTVNGSVDNSYASLSKTEAEKKAQNDSRLEKLNGGANWDLASTFETDIPYAKQGTSEILSKVSSMVGEKLTITSALGTKGASGKASPHKIGGYASHHNAENPKLDINITSVSHGEKLAQKLHETGYFSHIAIESDHLDVQIDPSKYEKVSIVA